MNEQTIRESFSKVREDIEKIHAQLLELSSKQAELVEMINSIKKDASKKSSNKNKK